MNITTTFAMCSNMTVKSMDNVLNSANESVQIMVLRFHSVNTILQLGNSF